MAREVWFAAGRQLERRGSGLSARREDDERRLPISSSDAHWQGLLAALSDDGVVREVAPGRVEVHGPEGVVLTVVVAPGQWEQVLADHVDGDVELYVADLLGPRQDDETFLVCYRGDLVRSTREKLPPVRSRALEREIAGARAARGVEHLGWSASSPDLAESDG